MADKGILLGEGDINKDKPLKIIFHVVMSRISNNKIL